MMRMFVPSALKWNNNHISKMLCSQGVGSLLIVSFQQSRHHIHWQSAAHQIIFLFYSSLISYHFEWFGRTWKWHFTFLFFLFYRPSLTSEVSASMRQSTVLASRPHQFGRVYLFRSSLGWYLPSVSTASCQSSHQIDLRIVAANNWHSQFKSEPHASHWMWMWNTK